LGHPRQRREVVCLLHPLPGWFNIRIVIQLHRVIYATSIFTRQLLIDFE